LVEDSLMVQAARLGTHAEDIAGMGAWACATAHPVPEGQLSTTESEPQQAGRAGASRNTHVEEELPRSRAVPGLDAAGDAAKKPA
jgi:hypothetical protein